MDKRERTASPWRVGDTAGRAEITDFEGNVLAEFFGDDQDPNCWPVTANADFAVKACNSYDALVASLDECSSVLIDLRTAVDRDDLWPKHASFVIDRAAALLAALRGIMSKKTN